MPAPADPTYYDVATLLQSGSFGTLGVDLFGGEWGVADRQILVLETSAPVSDVPATFESTGVQILIRGDKGERDLAVYRRAKLL